MRRALISTAAALVLGLVPLWPAGAEPQTAPNTFVKITFAGGPVGVVQSSGAINSLGLALEETVLNSDGTFTGTLTFTFPLGTVTAPYAGQVTSVSIDGVCRGRFTTTGTFTITAGTGRYAGISGSGAFTERGVFNGVPTGSGCVPDLQVRTYLTTDATATVHLAPQPLGGLL